MQPIIPRALPITRQVKIRVSYQKLLKCWVYNQLKTKAPKVMDHSDTDVSCMIVFTCAAAWAKGVHRTGVVCVGGEGGNDNTHACRAYTQGSGQGGAIARTKTCASLQHILTCQRSIDSTGPTRR